MKNFRSQFTQTAKGLVLLLAFMAGGVLVASAADWIAPTNSPPQENAPAPINVSNDNQLKGTAGGAALSFLPYAANTPAFMASLPATSTSRAIFSWSGLGVVGNSDFYGNVTAGSAGTIPSYNSGTGHYQYELNSWLPAIFHGRPLTVDLKTGLSTNIGANGRNALNLVGTDDNDSIGIIQNKPKFFLWDYSASGGGDLASLVAKNGDFSGNVDAQTLHVEDSTVLDGSLRASGGNPKANSVLTSINDSGDAEWRPVSSLIDIKYMAHKWPGYNADDFGDMQCPQGYIAISANCDCQGGLDACLIAQLNPQNNAVGLIDFPGALPSNAAQVGSDIQYTVDWGVQDPRPDWVTGNCRTNGDLHIQATCLRVADQGNNPQFVWKNIQAKNRKFCNNWGSLWTGSSAGHGCSVVWDSPEESPVVWVGGAGMSASQWYAQLATQGSSYAYAIWNAYPNEPTSHIWGSPTNCFDNLNDTCWQAQYASGLQVSQSQLANINTGVRHDKFRDGPYAAQDETVAGCLYTDLPPGAGRPSANRLNWNVDAQSQYSGHIYSGPCEDNPQGDNDGPGGSYPGMLFPILTNEILFLKG